MPLATEPARGPISRGGMDMARRLNPAVYVIDGWDDIRGETILEVFYRRPDAEERYKKLVSRWDKVHSKKDMPLGPRLPTEGLYIDIVRRTIK
jgi:hypothetical protein